MGVLLKHTVLYLLNIYVLDGLQLNMEVLEYEYLIENIHFLPELISFHKYLTWVWQFSGLGVEI